MTNSVRFYRDVLGMEIIYGGEDGYFSSLRTKPNDKLVTRPRKIRDLTRQNPRPGTA